jgi:hypothetical protein
MRTLLAVVSLAMSATACDGIAGIQMHVLAEGGAADGGCGDAGPEAAAECVPPVEEAGDAAEAGVD